MSTCCQDKSQSPALPANLRIALAGNPNCGKTTIFNALTGSHQHVGNYSGVTVEHKSGQADFCGHNVEVVDLPGIYSLSSSSPEERVAADELLHTHVDLILNIIDSSNLQRNLYLTTQLTELNIPMLLVFNMADEAREKGFVFNFPMLERFLGHPIIETVGNNPSSLEAMKEKAIDIIAHLDTRVPPPHIQYDEHLDAAIADLEARIATRDLKHDEHISNRYFAIKLLEGDPHATAMPAIADLLPLSQKYREQLAASHGVNSETLMADARYGLIAGACREAITLRVMHRREISDKIDAIVTNKFLGLPIFLLLMFLVFVFTFTCGKPLIAILEFVFHQLSVAISTHWPAGHAEFVRDLICEGIIGGVGGVLVFLPNILLLFLAIAFLEGTGYMARAAFIMDGFMHRFSLHGKSFIPLVLGFGCTVPAVLATRIIESRRDRLTTIMVLPMMSCGARLPIYALLIPIFFPEKYQALILWYIYLAGVIIALFAAKLLKNTLFKGENEVFVMELPPYRIPTVGSLALHVWERCLMYLKKAGTFILGASIIMFFCNTFPRKTSDFTRDYEAEISILEAQADLAPEAKAFQIAELKAERQAEISAATITGRLGHWLEPVFRPLGFDWRVDSALIGAIAGKELFVSQLGILYASDDNGDGTDTLKEKLRANYTPLQSLSIMIFCLLTIPCVGTMAVVRRETRSVLLTLGQAAGLFIIAWVLAFAVYQVGLFLGLGTHLLS